MTRLRSAALVAAAIAVALVLVLAWWWSGRPDPGDGPRPGASASVGGTPDGDPIATSVPTPTWAAASPGATTGPGDATSTVGAPPIVGKDPATPATRDPRPVPTGANPSVPAPHVVLTLRATASGPATVSWGPVEGPFETAPISGEWSIDVSPDDFDTTVLVTVESATPARLSCEISSDGVVAEQRRPPGPVTITRCAVNTKLAG